MFTKRLHVFKAGAQTSAQGIERDFTPKDLEEVVQSYDPGTHEAPVVIGHSGDNDSAPSYGWIKQFVRKGDNLYADVSFTDVAKDLVKDGHYRKVSISFYSPSSPINPHKGKWSARHLALLGASPPAVKGLEPFSFSEEEGVFDYATALTPENIFDTDLGPTMIEEKSPLELLKERLDEIRGEISDSLKELQENQEKQAQVDVGQGEEAAPSMEAQQFSELKKKASEASQKLANLETMMPSDSYDEGVKRVKAEGAHGHEVQVVEEVFEEKAEKTKKSQKSAEMALKLAEEVEDEFAEDGVIRKVSKGAHGQEVQVVEQVFKEKNKKKGLEPVIVEEDLEEDEEFKEKGGVPAGMSLEGEEMTEDNEEKGRKKKAPSRGLQMDGGEFKETGKAKKAKEMMEESDDILSEDDDMGEFGEGAGHKMAKDSKVMFGTHAEKDLSNPAGRGSTGRSTDDSYADRQAVGKGDPDGREMTSDDMGTQDKKREKVSKNSEQDESREKLAKASSQDNTDAESRWAEQNGKDRVMNADQYDIGEKGLPERSKPGISDGDEPHGRDGGPTKVSTLMEEDPSNQEFAVDLETTKGNKTVRVLHQQSGDKRASVKGGEIPDHADEVSHAEGVGHKITKDGEVSFGTHPEKSGDATGREKSGHGEDDMESRHVAAKSPEEDREGVIDDSGEQDEDRMKTAKHSEQDEDRVKTAKHSSDDRWEDQPEGASRAMNNNQFDDSEEGLPEGVKPGVSDGDEPYGRDGGPTRVPTIVEEEPSNEEVAVPLENVKQSDKVRVVYQKAGEKRAAVKGGEIPDHADEVSHAEGEADGLTREPKKAKVSDGTDPRGRDNGPTEFPTLSEEDPDDLEMAVDLEDATQSKKVRILRQKSGDMPSVDHKEKAKTSMTKTGKGSTYGQNSPVLVEEETEEFCGMGSLGQAKAMGYPTAMFEELKALKAENDRLKKEYEEQKIRARKAKISEFVEGLYVSGKLTDGVIPQGQLQNYCEGLEFGTLEFSEGESPTTTLFSLLERLPNMVYFGEVVANSAFQEAEDEDMDPHERAMKMVANGEAADYVEAIKHCIPWGSN